MLIKGYKRGSNITLLNTIYIRAQKLANGSYSDDYLYIIYKDLDTGEKKMQEIQSPDYTYYMLNDGIPATYNRLYIDKKYVHPVRSKYNKIKNSIAKQTGNLEWFRNNNQTGNYKENDKLYKIPSVFFADTDIEDYYRFLFDMEYKNEPFNPSKLYFDIETDIINMRGDFPEPGECPINAVTLIDEEHKNIYVLLLENYNNPLIEEFKNTPNITTELKDFVRERVGGWKREIEFGLDQFNYKIAFFDEEINLITTCFRIINYIKPDFALAWNIAFDLPYFIARIRNLGFNPNNIICHPDFNVRICEYNIDNRADKFEQRNDEAKISSYTVYLDQLILYASRRKGQRAIGSYKLDFVGQHEAGVNKLDYSAITSNIAKLPYLDYHTFVFYNCMDTIVQYCIECKTGDVDFVLNKSITTLTRYSKIHRQTTYLVNRNKRDFFNMGYVMGNNINKSNPKQSFAGAFVADPKLVSDKPKVKINGKAINILRNNDDFDFTALYPSIIEQSNMSPATMHGKVLFDQPTDKLENRFDNPYYDRSVWFMEDLISNNIIDFCHRHLGMPNYEEMYDLITKYFTEVKNTNNKLHPIDVYSGKPILVRKVNKNERRQLFHVVKDKTAKRRLFRVYSEVPKK